MMPTAFLSCVFRFWRSVSTRPAFLACSQKSSIGKFSKSRTTPSHSLDVGKQKRFWKSVKNADPVLFFMHIELERFHALSYICSSSIWIFLLCVFEGRDFLYQRKLSTGLLMYRVLQDYTRETVFQKLKTIRNAIESKRLIAKISFLQINPCLNSKTIFTPRSPRTDVHT